MGHRLVCLSLPHLCGFEWPPPDSGLLAAPWKYAVYGDQGVRHVEVQVPLGAGAEPEGPR